MYLGIDLGTASVKLMRVAADGTREVRSKPYAVRTPREGWAETDPQEWLSAIEAGLREISDLHRVEAIGFSGQMHGIVPDSSESGSPAELGPAITWADQRGASYLPILERLDSSVRRAIGNPPSAGMAAVSLLWLRDHAAETFRRMRRALLPKDYVRAYLTGTGNTDYSDAGGTLLYDFTRRRWHGELLREIGLPADILPPIVYGTDVVGYVRDDAARRLGLPAGVPVVAGGGDTPAAMVGTGLTDVGTAQISVGTAAQVCRPIAADHLPEDRRLNVFEGAVRNQRLHIAAMLNGGLALEWVRGILGFDWSSLYERLEARGLSAPCDLVFLPYLAGERTPHMDADARGAWTGLSLRHGADDLALAALLGVAATVRLGLETLASAGTEQITTLRLVGGSARFPFWRRLLGAMLGRDLLVSDVSDSSVLGAARLAAMGIDRSPPPIPAFDNQTTNPIDWIDEYYQRFLDTWRRNGDPT